MPLSNSRLAYTDVFEAYDKALEDEKGIRIKMRDLDDATFTRLRFNGARRIDRDDNRRTYDKDNPMYGRSIYDTLTCKIKTIDDTVWLYVLHTVAFDRIEPLSEIDEVEVEAPELVLAEPIEAPKPMVVERLIRRM